MAVQPYEIANFNLISFASMYNNFVSYDPKEMQVQYMDEEGVIKTITVKNIGMITDEVKDGINKESVEREAADNEIKEKITEYYNEVKNTLTNEVSQRTEADEKLETLIDALSSKVQQDIQKLNDGLSSEIDERVSADKKLQDSINDEKVSRVAADQSLQANISKEEAERKASDEKIVDDFTQSLDKESKERKEADENTLKESKDYTDLSVDKETSRAKAAEGNLEFNDDLTSKNLTDAINEVDDKYFKVTSNLQTTLDSILKDSNIDLDSFKEVVDYINNNKTDILSSLENIKTSIKAEKNDRMNAEQALANALKEEGDKRAFKDNDLQKQIDDLKKEKLDQETINSLKKEFKDGIDNETSRAKAAEGSLEFNADIDADNLTDAINDVDDKIVITKSELQEALSKQDNMIKSILRDSDVDLDSFKEVVDYINNNKSDVINKLIEITSDLKAEIVERKAEDKALAKDIIKEVSERKTADENLAKNISEEVSERESADKDLQKQIDDLTERVKKLEECCSGFLMFKKEADDNKINTPAPTTAKPESDGIVIGDNTPAAPMPEVDNTEGNEVKPAPMPEVDNTEGNNENIAEEITETVMDEISKVYNK